MNWNIFSVTLDPEERTSCLERKISMKEEWDGGLTRKIGDKARSEKPTGDPVQWPNH